MTRVLFIGDIREHTRTQQRLHALRSLVDEVVTVGTHRDDGQSLGSGKPSLLARVANKLGRPFDLTRASHQARTELARGGIDLLWVEKALALDPQVVMTANMPRVFMSEDDMAQAHNQSVYFRQALQHFDLVVTTKPRNAEPDGLGRFGARNLMVVAKTFDPQLHRPVQLTPAEQDLFGSDAAFVGTFEAERSRDLSALAEAGIDVRVWGNGWKGRSVSTKLRVEHRPVIGDDYARVLSASKVNFCFLRRANQDQSTARSAEIPACGAFMLAERSPEHDTLFREGTEAEFFGDTAELLEKTQAALANPEQRARVATNGRLRVNQDQRTHAACVERILQRALGLDRSGT